MKDYKFVLLVLAILFFVSAAFSQAVLVISPSQGEVWGRGTAHTITWNKYGTIDTKVKIRLYNLEGTIKILNITNDTDNSNTTNSYLVPKGFFNTVANGLYRIRVKTLDNEVFRDSQWFRIKDLSDLFIKKMSVAPRSPTILDSTRLSFVIQNQGTERCEASKVRIEIKKKDGTVILERMVNVFALDPNKTFSCRLVLGRVTEPGSYSYEILANYSNIARESNYGNNLGGVPVTVHGVPDLIVCYRPYRTRITVKKKMAALVKNIGSKRSEPCKLSYGISGRGTRLFDVPALDPGMVFRVSRTERWYKGGTRRLVLWVDSHNKVFELKENNNRAETRVAVYVVGPPKYVSPTYTCTDGSEIDN